MKLIGFALMLCLAVVGCKKSEDSFDPNYSKQVTLSPADKAKAEDLKDAGGTAPQTVPGGAGAAVPFPKGKTPGH